jgi:hypothetical protein
MKITLSPQRRNDVLSISKSGDVITINGEVFDFSALPNGASLEASEIPCDWLFGTIERVDGDLHLQIILPHGPNPSDAVAFPSPLTNLQDGQISLPVDLVVNDVLIEEVTHVDG